MNVVLSPIVDVVAGPNPWLDGRTISTDPGAVARVATSFVRGVQASGRVAATAKHFPGHPSVPLDPAEHETSVAETSDQATEDNLALFRAVIDAGVDVVMTGPTLVPALDTDRAASRSPAVVQLLRDDCGFDGVVLSDDLDVPGVLRGDPIEEAVVDALSAGVDWLLVVGSPALPDLVDAVVDAVEDGRLDDQRLHDAATAVRDLTGRVG